MDNTQILSLLIEELATTRIGKKKSSEIVGKISDELSKYRLIELNPAQVAIEDDDFLKRFLTAKEVEGRSWRTIKRYNYIITHLLKYLNVRTDAVDVYGLREYLHFRKDNGISDRTLEGERSVFSSYFGWLYKEGLIQKNPCANLGPVKYKKKLKVPFSDIDIARLKESCKTLRERVLINLLLCTGCRISEICALNKQDINFETLEITVLGKGNKERTVYIDGVTAMLLKDYFDSRTDNEEALFVGKGSTRMTAGGLRHLLKNIGEAAQVDNVHPHRFRRTLATNLINRGMTIQEVAAILGHENINTTMTYVFIDKVNVKNNYKKFY